MTSKLDKIEALIVRLVGALSWHAGHTGLRSEEVEKLIAGSQEALALIQDLRESYEA